LKDKYLQIETPISFTNVTTINFNITADAASRVVDRFMIVFKQAALINFTTIAAIRNADKTITIHWGIQNEINVNNYTIEQSNDGINFTAINTQLPIANNGTNPFYNKIDFAASKNNNWYRIKATSTNGIEKYSSIAMVAAIPADAVTTESSITVYPNPIVNKKIFNIQFINKIGNYQLQLISSDGKIIYNENIVITAIKELKKVSLHKHIAAGHYELVVIESNGERVVVPIVLM
jgi:hypothetical protein